MENVYKTAQVAKIIGVHPNTVRLYEELGLIPIPLRLCTLFFNFAGTCISYRNDFFYYQLNGSWIAFLGGYFLVMISMFSIGLMVGGIAPNTKIAGAIASVLYFPMLIFSGATLPYEVMPPILQKVADVLPLTQGIKILKAASLGLQAENIFLPTIIMVVISVICIGMAVKFFRWE